MEDLATCLRAWRDRLDPAEAGVRTDGYRRAPGLRREEVARLTGLSVDYLARLEQGRATHPSPSVLAPLARTLRLNDAERDHLFRLAGQSPPACMAEGLSMSRTIDRHLTPGVQRVMDRLADVPVLVIDATWQVIAVNELAGALLGYPQITRGREHNYAWSAFAGTPSRVDFTEEQWGRQREEVVADLRDAFGRFPGDTPLRDLIADLHALSPEFTRLWEAGHVRPRSESRKTIVHPEVGPITVDCDVLTVRDSDVRLIVYTTAPGSPEAQALELVGVLGQQRLTPSDVPRH